MSLVSNERAMLPARAGVARAGAVRAGAASKRTGLNDKGVQGHLWNKTTPDPAGAAAWVKVRD